MTGANTATTNKQAAGNGQVVSEETANTWLKKVEELYNHAQKVYDFGLDYGVPKELARIVMPVGRYSRMRASGNLRNWLGFLALRQDSSAQYEIRQYADAVCQIVEGVFPRTNVLFQER